MGFRLCPDDEYVGDWCIGNPHFRAAQAVADLDFFSAGLHAAGIGAGIRLGQAETADQFARDEAGQIFLFLLVGAVGEDRIDDQRGLDAHHRAVARIDPFDLAGDEAIGDVGGIGCAIFFRKRDAEEAGLTHQLEEADIGLFLKIGFLDPWQEFGLGKGGRRVADHTLLFGQLIFDEEGVVPDKGQGGLRCFWTGRVSQSPSNFPCRLSSCGRLSQGPFTQSAMRVSNRA
ncbi:hypothetical protein D3C73_726460 [compost metagenome]